MEAAFIHVDSSRTVLEHYAMTYILSLSSHTHIQRERERERERERDREEKEREKHTNLYKLASMFLLAGTMCIKS